MSIQDAEGYLLLLLKLEGAIVDCIVDLESLPSVCSLPDLMRFT
jgi:hypothetical protein